MKTAQESAAKFVARASVAGDDYVKGAAGTAKDQAANAIASKKIYQDALTASFSRDAFAKGLAKSGKSGWLNGIQKKGADRFAPGVAASADKYATESAKFDTARNASANMPRGLKGSATNLAKVATVVNALRATKLAM